jgi:single-strand DNA-binding protein
MASRSLNKAELIGNLTRDPELRYTPSGTPVCTFSLATNRQWVTESGEKKEDVEFHRLVAWQKLAEICGKFLTKGRKVWVQGRLQTRSWTGQDGAARQVTEIVVEDMIILDSARNLPESEKKDQAEPVPEKAVEQPTKKKTKKHEDATEVTEPVISQDIKEEVAPDEIPF